MENLIVPINNEEKTEKKDEYFGCGAVDTCDTCQSICSWGAR